MLLSRGSPGTICQWWNTWRQKACPCVCVLRSVSKPNESMAGTNALIVYSGDPATGASWVTWPGQEKKVYVTADRSWVTLTFHPKRRDVFKY